MRRMPGPAAAILLLCGCGGAVEDKAKTESTSADNAPPAPASTGALPPPETALRFVGRWAAEARLCADRAWRFTRTSLSMPAGSSCRFSQVRPVPGGFDIVARCAAEGPPRDDRLSIRFAESAQAMLFESDTIADTGLVYCGPA